jgi:hypothetical protein
MEKFFSCKAAMGSLYRHYREYTVNCQQIGNIDAILKMRYCHAIRPSTPNISDPIAFYHSPLTIIGTHLAALN